MSYIVVAWVGCGVSNAFWLCSIGSEVEWLHRLFTIFMGNWLVHGLGKWYAKFRTGKFHPGVAFTTWTKHFHYQKTAAKPEIGIKDGFEDMEHEFPFGAFWPEKICSVAPGNFPLGRPKKSCSIFFPTRFSGNVLWMVNNHSALSDIRQLELGKLMFSFRHSRYC